LELAVFFPYIQEVLGLRTRFVFTYVRKPNLSGSRITLSKCTNRGSLTLKSLCNKYPNHLHKLTPCCICYVCKKKLLAAKYTVTGCTLSIYNEGVKHMQKPSNLKRWRMAETESLNSSTARGHLLTTPT